MAGAMNPGEPVGFACRLTDREMVARKDQVARLFGERAESVSATETDVVLTFAEPDECLPDIVEFIRLERDCCPFLAWRIEIAPDGGPLTLAIGGTAEKRAFFVAELGEALAIHAERRA